jgi:hypothetical protein
VKIIAKQIDMLAVFEQDGTVKPQRFRLVGDDQTVRTIKVDQIITTTETKTGGIKALLFACQSSVGNVMKRYELRYCIDDHRWEMFKM